MTLREKVIERIQAEQAEITRIQADAQTNLAAARARLAVLVRARDVLTPELEELVTLLQRIGVRILE